MNFRFNGLLTFQISNLNIIYRRLHYNLAFPWFFFFKLTIKNLFML